MIVRSLAALLLLAATAPVDSQVPTPRMRPAPANHSQFLGDQDFAQFRIGLQAADDEDFATLRASRDRLTDSAARNVLTWLLALNDPRASFVELDHALGELNDWPRNSFIRSEAESKISSSGLSAPYIVSWFEANPPVTGRGYIAFAEALIDVGRSAEGEEILRDTWRSRRLPLPVQRDVYRTHQDRLTQEDHIARVDYLIWSNQRTAARRVTALLTGAERNLADARLRLAGRQSGVDRAVQSVPASMRNDPGLVFERARWRRRSGMRDSVLPLLLQLPDDHTDVNALDLMWTERKLMILRLIRDQDYANAYALAQAHGMERGADFADAEFMAGWLALVHLDDAPAAMAHFTTLRDNVSTPVSVSRAHYWMARASDAMGDPGMAATYYERAGEHSTAFYGQLALAQLAGDQAEIAFEADPEPSAEARQRFEARPMIQAMRLLAEQGEDYYYRLFSYRVDDMLTDPEEAVLLAQLSENYLYTRQAVRAAKAARQRGVILPQSAYPTISLPAQTGGERPHDAVVHSVIRQETEFSQFAVSGAGARGMMQMMPATARQTARQLGEPYRFTWLTDDLEYNLRLGMHHLGEVLEDYDGSYVMALAAYNAGGHRVRRWVEDYGDPRSPDVDPIDWVESIPFSETRNYVMRVMENMQVYRTRLADDSAVPLTIEQDLNAGSPGN